MWFVSELDFVCYWRECQCAKENVGCPAPSLAINKMPMDSPTAEGLSRRRSDSYREQQDEDGMIDSVNLLDSSMWKDNIVTNENERRLGKTH